MVILCFMTKNEKLLDIMIDEKTRNLFIYSPPYTKEFISLAEAWRLNPYMTREDYLKQYDYMKLLISRMSSIQEVKDYVIKDCVEKDGLIFLGERVGWFAQRSNSLSDYTRLIIMGLCEEAE